MPKQFSIKKTKMYLSIERERGKHRVKLALTGGTRLNGHT